MNTKITTLFLDIGGVLLTNGWDRGMRQKAAEHFNLDSAEMDERHHLTYDTYEEGKLSLDSYLTRLVFYEARPFSRDEFIKFMNEQSKAYPQLIELVRKLKDRYHLRVATISNEGKELTEYRIRKFRLNEFVDFFISSCFVHYRKPDEDIFRIALDVAQVPPEKVAYIEDRQLFVEVARGLGMNAIQHTDLDATKVKLDGLGLVLE